LKIYPINMSSIAEKQDSQSNASSTQLATNTDKEQSVDTIAEAGRSASSTAIPEDDARDTDEKNDVGVAHLARQFTRESIRRSHSVINPFFSSDPELDPNSPAFSPSHWARALLHAISRDADRYPTRTAGISHRDLSVHGFGTDMDYQKDVLNVLLGGPEIAMNWMGKRGGKTQILKDFDGLVRSGEMLLVLGRPGR
jgi:ATP-binding cassette subfamily G (WHITE) protein 2 (PDR)